MVRHLRLDGSCLVSPDPGRATGRLAGGQIAARAVGGEVAANRAGADGKEARRLGLRHAALHRANNPNA